MTIPWGCHQCANAVIRWERDARPDDRDQLPRHQLQYHSPNASRAIVCRFQKEPFAIGHNQNLATTQSVGNPNALPTLFMLDGGPQDY